MFTPSKRRPSRRRWLSMKKGHSDASKGESTNSPAPIDRQSTEGETNTFQYEEFLEAARVIMDELIVEQYWLKEQWKKRHEEFIAALVSLQGVIIDNIEEFERRQNSTIRGERQIHQLSNDDLIRKKMEAKCNDCQFRLSCIIEERDAVDMRRLQLLEFYRQERNRQNIGFGFGMPRRLVNLAVLAHNRSKTSQEAPDEASILEMYRKSSASQGPIDCLCPYCEQYGSRKFENFRDHSAHLTKVYSIVVHPGYYRCASSHCKEKRLWLFRDNFETHTRKAHSKVDQLDLMHSSLCSIATIGSSAGAFPFSPGLQQLMGGPDKEYIMNIIDDIISTYHGLHFTWPSCDLGHIDSKGSLSGSLYIAGRTSTSTKTRSSGDTALSDSKSRLESKFLAGRDAISESKTIPESTGMNARDDSNSWPNKVQQDKMTVPAGDPERLAIARSAENQAEPEAAAGSNFELPHFFSQCHGSKASDLQSHLPEWLQWDIEYGETSSKRGHWTCTPSDPSCKEAFPLTIAQHPVIIPVNHRWPPIGGVNPPPDPKPSSPIDCTISLPIEIIWDIFKTFEGSLGFYVLINGLLQIIVREEFDTEWATSHLPHKYGGLKVTFIKQTLVPTMLPRTEGSRIDDDDDKAEPVNRPSALSRLSGVFRPSRLVQFTSASSQNSTLQLNDFIEAKPKSTHQRERYAGRVGLRVGNEGKQYLIMSTHVIVEAILAKSIREMLFEDRESLQRLDSDWNQHVEIRAKNERIGSIFKSMDPKNDIGIYPVGFIHDVTLIAPLNQRAIQGVQSPIPGLGWLSGQGHRSLRQQSNQVKFLDGSRTTRNGKSLQTIRHRDIMIVGEGIFLNQNAAPKQPHGGHSKSVWNSMVSRALLYRVYPDFDPPNGYSGTALYAENGLRVDGSTGPAVVGFQSFVQRSGHIQNFNMDGDPLSRRLESGLVAFYGAFQVPEEMRNGYTIF